MNHPRRELDDAFLTPLRLSLMAALPADRELDFAALRELLDTDDSQLSKAISHLEKAGYAKVTKGFVGTRTRTWVVSTLAGRKAFAAHVAALRAITATALD